MSKRTFVHKYRTFSEILQLMGKNPSGRLWKVEAWKSGWISHKDLIEMQKEVDNA